MFKKLIIILSLIIPNIANASTLVDAVEEIISNKLDIQQVYATPFAKYKIRDDADIVIQNMQLDELNKKFKANVNADGIPKEVSGSYEPANLVPVLKDTLPVGAIISEQHIAYIKVPISKDLRAYHATKEEMVGKIAKRKVFANQLVHLKNLANPSIVDKGANVKMLFSRANLAIEANGVAMENGGKDEYIRVKNLSSNKIVKAKVLDEKTVSAGN